jgi:hypothetical protein
LVFLILFFFSPGLSNQKSKFDVLSIILCFGVTLIVIIDTFVIAYCPVYSRQSLYCATFNEFKTTTIHVIWYLHLTLGSWRDGVTVTHIDCQHSS